MFIYTICNSQYNCNQNIVSSLWYIIIILKILCSFGHMMQGFLPRFLLVLIGIPLWPHQLILQYFPVSLPQTFFILFDSYSHVRSFLSQYPFNSPMIILGFWVTCEVKMMSLHHDWSWQPPQSLLPASIIDIYKKFEHIDMLFWGIRQQP